MSTRPAPVEMAMSTLREDFLLAVVAANGFKGPSVDQIEPYLDAYDEGVREAHAKLVCDPCRRGDGRLWSRDDRRWTHSQTKRMGGAIWCRATALFPEPRA